MAEFAESMTDDGSCVLAVAGEIDLDCADELVSRAQTCLDRGVPLTLDVSGIEFMDSSGLGALVRIRNEAAARELALIIANMTPRLDRLFQITGLLDAFDVRQTRA